MSRIINLCPKCGDLMEAREHDKKPKNETYFFTMWFYCARCKHVQHMERFKIKLDKII